MQKFDLKQIQKRTSGTPLDLQRVELADAITAYGAVRFDLVKNKLGKEFLHLIDAQGHYISIGVSKKVNLEEEGPARIKELVDNFVIYAGQSDVAAGYSGNFYMTFSTEPTSNEPVATVTLAQLKSLMGDKVVAA